MRAQTAAILISVALAAAAESGAPLAADHAKAKAAQVTKRLSDVVHRLQAAAGKAVVRRARQTAPPPGRRLAGADAPQCAWTAGACEANDAFGESVLPATGALRDMWTEHTACKAHGSESACLAASCAWATDACEIRMTSEHMSGLMGSVFDADGAACGIASELLLASACYSNDAGSAQCSAANRCVTESRFGPSNGTCEAFEQCVMVEDESMSMSMFCGADFTPGDQQACMSEFFASSDPSSSTTPSPEAVQDFLLECMYGGCPAMMDMANLAISCSAFTDGTACGASPDCAWNSSSAACDATSEAVLDIMIPDGCSAKRLSQAFSRCEGRAQDACTGDCEWDTDARCDGAVLTEEGRCSLSDVAQFHALGLAGSLDAGALANMMRVEENCNSITSETECADASVALDAYEIADSSQRLTGAPAVLSLLMLGMAAIAET